MSDNRYRRPTNTPQQRPAPRPVAKTAAYSRKRRRARQRKRTILYISIIAAIIVLALILALLLKKPDNSDSSVKSVQKVENTAIPEATSEPTATPIPSPTPYNDVANPVYASLRPTPVAEGWLPVFNKIDTDEKVIAITVDDCYQAENLRTIIDLAIDHGAKLTFFPIGEQVLKSKQQEHLRYAWENGMELENHTFTHNGLYGCTDEELAAEIYKQNLALSKILGVEYQCHFLRPMGGDARYDQRIHAYLSQMGYFGVAHWSESGTRSVSKLKGILSPGQIYLFHTTDKDVQRLSYFIPYAVSQGYRLVTLNELFGYPQNEYADLKIPIEQHTIPPLLPYEKVYVTYSEGNYAYGILELQQRLVELGYLSGGADGIYGENTAKAIKMFQLASGIKDTGKASPETQEKLFSADAPKNTGNPI